MRSNKYVKQLFLFLFLTVLISSCSNNPKEEKMLNDAHKMGLRGNIKSLISEGKELRFTENGYLNSEPNFKYHYDSESRLTKIVYLSSSGKSFGHEIYHYNDMGNLSEHIFFRGDIYSDGTKKTAIDYRTDYTYDTHGRLTNKIRRDFTNKSQATLNTTYSYDENGKLSNETLVVSNPPKNLKFKDKTVEYKYDRQERLMEKLFYDQNDFCTEIIKYDKNGNEVELIKYEYSSTEKETRNYNTTGILIETDDGEKELTVKIFDNDGNIIEQFRSGSFQSWENYHIFFKYEFDKYGNWIKQTALNKDGNEEYFNERQITYYN